MGMQGVIVTVVGLLFSLETSGVQTVTNVTMEVPRCSKFLACTQNSLKPEKGKYTRISGTHFFSWYIAQRVHVAI